jgi:hypothetical protein
MKLTDDTFTCRHHNASGERGPSPLYRPTSASLRGMNHQRSETTGGGSMYEEHDYTDRDDDSGKGGLTASGYRRARAG